MTADLFSFALLAVAFILSPGPGNALLAVGGARFGFARSIPFWLGFDLANAMLTLLYAFGLSEILGNFPQLYSALKIIGAVYIFYIAYKFFTDTKALEKGDVDPMSFRDGFISVLLNPKIHSSLGIIFTQFINPSQSSTFYVLILVVIFIVISIISHGIWIIGGDLIFRKFQSERQVRAQNIGFGVLIFAVGVYSLLH